MMFFLCRLVRLCRAGPALRMSSLGVLLLFVGGCESEFDLSDTRVREQAAIRDTDRFQAAAANKDWVVLVGNGGIVLVSADRGETWSRSRLPADTSLLFPDLIDVAVCPDGTFVALDGARGVWFSARNVERWARSPVRLKEEGFDLTCDSHGRVWVVGAFMSITSSSDQGQIWNDQSLGDDAIFTSIQFTGPDEGIIVGEFGLHYRSTNRGASWVAQSPIPNEFYPLAALFRDSDKGWLAGLQGTVLYTPDGGVTWTKQETGVRVPIYGLTSDGTGFRAVGGRGTAFELSGDHWSLLEGGSSHGYLRAIVPVGDGKFIAAGEGGRVSLLGGEAPVK